MPSGYSQKPLFHAYIFLILSSLMLCGCAEKHFKTVYVTTRCIQAEIVDSDLKRQQGLMFRKKLADNKGMLFIFEQEGMYSIWMKNMNFPLDIIWIDAQKRIVDIREGALPCKESCESLFPKGEARYVLEVNSGFTRKHKIKIGDMINF